MKIRLNIFLFFGTLLLLFFTLAVYILRVKLSGLHYGQTDFFKFYESVRFYFAGQNLYDPTIMKIERDATITWITANGNLNPPFLTFFLLPLYYFNYADSLTIWTIASLIFLFIGGILALRPFRQWHKYTLPIMTVFAIYIPNSANLAYGQVANFLLVLLAGAFILGRKNRDISAGTLIGIACAIKIFCGLFLIYFLCIKRFRLLGSALFTGAIAFISSILFFGINNYLSYKAVLKKIVWYSASWNVSFYGFFIRLFSNTEKNKTLLAVPHLATLLTIFFSLVLFICLIYSWRKLGTLRFDIGYSLTMIAMLLLSPLGWIYYFVLLIIPFFVLLSESKTTKHALALPLWACGLLFISQLSGNFISTVGIKTTTEILINGGMGFYALFGFFLLYIFLIKEKLQTNSIVSPVPTLNVTHWSVIYLVALFPSLLSLFIVAKNVWQGIF